MPLHARLTLLLAIVALTAPAAAASRPNILFIQVDDLSYKYLGAFGSKVARTPHLDSLARRGVLFRHAMSQGMMCAPSRNSLITGLYPHNLGLYRNGQLGELPRGTWALPAALQRSGYYTAWVGKSHILAPGARTNPDALRTEMGFDRVNFTLGRAGLGRGKRAIDDWYLSHLKAKGLLEQFRRERGRPSTLPEDDYLDGFFTRTALDFLASYRERKPFFLWINYSLPHEPYDVNRKYLERFRPEEMPGLTQTDYPVPEGLVQGAALSEARSRQKQAAYCATIAFLDDQVGRILEVLEEKRLLKSSVIVFFSDQGVMLGDHGRAHKGTLFRQVANPALIISWPTRFRQNSVVDAPVELQDLLKTSLEIAGAPEEERSRVRGYSLVPLLTGQGSFGREVAFGEIEGWVAASNGRYRLIQGADASLLFDEVSDPDNLHDISRAHPELVASLGQRIDEWLAASGPVLEPQAAAGGGDRGE